MSASLSAMGVVASPGSSVMAAEAAVEAAASSRTVDCYSSSAVREAAWVSAEAAQGVTRAKDKMAADSSAAARAQVVPFLSRMWFTPPAGGPFSVLGGGGRFFILAYVGNGGKMAQGTRAVMARSRTARKAKLTALKRARKRLLPPGTRFVYSRKVMRLAREATNVPAPPMFTPSRRPR